MSKVIELFPANDFKYVAKHSSERIECGVIIGYSPDGELLAYGGGMLDGKEPVSKDWLWIVESFKQKLIAGEFSED